MRQQHSAIHNTLVRTVLFPSILATLGCASAQTATHPIEAPRAATPIATPQKATSMHTATVSLGHPAHIAAESLTIELVSVKDSRCPQGVTCIWAGHAAVALKVGKPGVATTTITIGTDAPRHMALPYDAEYADYSFHLVKLEPGNTQSPATRYRATVRVSAGVSPPPHPEASDR